MEYTNFMNEYDRLGHMERIGSVNAMDQIERPKYYIPHHAVVKMSSSTTMVRVVYDASAMSTNGTSFNDHLISGPFIQSDLFSIIIRFRFHNVVIFADVEKMFRQVWVNQQQQDLQRIIWRSDECQDLNVYRLKTVTYGTAPATYLTTRCLKELALINSKKYPLAAKIILKDMYVQNVHIVAELSIEIQGILREGGFNLRKWQSNTEEVLTKLEGARTERHLIRDASEDKTLGVAWNSKKDVLGFSVREPTDIDSCTVSRRIILSAIARTFDPLGIASPIIVSLKMLVQALCTMKLNWDYPVSEAIKDKFIRLRQQIETLKPLEIARHVITPKPIGIQIHGFCDSSEKAYGAAVYVRSVYSDGNVYARLLCAKTRVTTLKNTTLPKLELCGAVLLVTLISNVIKASRCEASKIIYWSDPKIVLSRIAAESSRWNTFMANRVAEIHRLTQLNSSWKHVNGKSNPADIISREARAETLQQTFWWNGPPWLSDNEKTWPTNTQIEDTILESGAKKSSVFHLQAFFIINQVAASCHLVYEIQGATTRPTSRGKIGISFETFN